MPLLHRLPALLAPALAFGLSGGLAAAPAESGPGMPAIRELQVRVWLDRGYDAVLQRGDRARVYYHVSHDAYVAIFHIDTNGTVRLLQPASPAEADWVRGGRDYRLLFPRSSYWYVEDDPGVGYFFAVASPEPFDFSRFRHSFFYGGWDLIGVGRQVYRDPYAAMDDYVAALIPDWEWADYALDFTSYQVGGSWDYPRFLCYDCHGFRPWSVWNPYVAACVSFRVVVYSDPWYYPVHRYRGTQVVYVRPPLPGQPRYVFKERARGEPSTPLVRRREDSIVGGAPPAGVRVTPGGEPGGVVRRGSEGAVPSPSGRPGDAATPPRRGGGTEPGAPPATRDLPTLERRAPDRPPPAPSSPPVRSTPPPAPSSPPARSTPPPAPSSPPARSTPPAPAPSSPPARSTPPPAPSSPPARSTPPPAPSSPPARSTPPAPVRSPPPGPPPGRGGGA